MAVRLAALCLFLAPTATPADWSRFRGPDGSGVSPETELPLTWGRADNVAWRTDLPGPGASSPVAVGGRVFLTCWTGFAVPGPPAGAEADLRLHLLGLDRRTGRLLWDTDVPAKPPVQRLSRGGEGYASSTPAADADRVYCFFGRTGVVAFDHAGKEVWRAAVGDGKAGWVSAASPVLYHDLVIVNASVEAEAVVALDAKTGRERWRARGVREAWNTPVVVAAEGGRDELVVPAAKTMFGLDPTTGETLWTCATDIGWYMVPSPVAHGGVAYCLGGRSGVVGLAVRAGGRGDVTATHRLWTSTRGSNVSSPVYHDGHLYWMNDANGMAYCARADTGAVVYEERVPRAGGVYASALLAGGRVYYVGRDGRTFVVAAAPRFELLATNDLGDRSDFDATPAVADGRLLIRSNNALYCVGKE